MSASHETTLGHKQSLDVVAYIVENLCVVTKYKINNQFLRGGQYG